MASYVVKVQNKGSIRRLTLAEGELGFSFEKLQSRIREVFQLLAGAQFALTYVDKDGDVVTMAEDEDLRDALVVQSLNPLRVTVEKFQDGRTDDGVKTSSPIPKTEANSGEVTKQQSSHDEVIPPQAESESLLVEAVAPAEPVSDSGINSSVAEEKASPIDEASDSNLADTFPATPGAVEDGKETRDSNPADASPATPGPVEDAKEIAQGKNKAAGDKATRVLHQGVQCDVCGIVPIEGPRFISATRYNYDLCRSCFEKSGSNASEYRRLDRPFACRGLPLAFTPIRHLVSSRLRQSPLCRRWIMVPNQFFPLFAIHSAGALPAQEKTPAAVACYDVKVGGHSVDASQAETAVTEDTSSATPVAPVDADATTTSSSKQELGTTEEQRVDAKARNNVDEIPVIFSTEEINTQTPAGEEDVASAEIGIGNISGETAGVEETNVQSPVAVEGKNSTNEDLAAKLATMGFEDSQLNAELLEKNNFDLRKTVDDLCAAEEWDPILGELQEMGFYDDNMNRRLMFKNNGSVKRVVKELVQMSREKLA